MIKPSQKQNPTGGSTSTEAEQGRACDGEAGAGMGAGAKLLPGQGAEPQEEDSSARAGRSVPTIPPAEKPLTWLQRRRQKRADVYQSAREEALEAAASIAPELARDLVAGRVTGAGLAEFVGVLVDNIQPGKSNRNLSEKQRRRLKAEVASAIISIITDQANSALNGLEDRRP